MAPTTLPNHFAEFSRLLNQEGAEYLLVGGWAVGLYGFAKYTDDVDLWFGDIELPVISRDDLIASKRASKRLRDLADIDELGG